MMMDIRVRLRNDDANGMRGERDREKGRVNEIRCIDCLPLSRLQDHYLLFRIEPSLLLAMRDGDEQFAHDFFPQILSN